MERLRKCKCRKTLTLPQRMVQAISDEKRSPVKVTVELDCADCGGVLYWTVTAQPKCEKIASNR